MPASALRPGALRDRDLRDGPVRRGSGRARARAGAVLRSYVGGGQADRAGRERRLRPPLRRARAPTLDRDDADRLRRRLAARADDNAEVLIGGRRCPLVGNVSAWTTSRSTSGAGAGVAVGDEVVLIGAQGDERIIAEEVARRLGTINYEITCGIDAARHRASYARAMAAPAWPSDAARRSRARRSPATPAWLVGGAVRDRLLGRAPTDGPRPRRRRATPRPPRGARARAARGAPFPAVRGRSAPGASSARDGAWQVDLCRCAAATLEADLAQRDFTVNAIAEPLAGGEPSTRTAAREDLARADGCGWSRRRRFAADPLRVAARRAASRASSASSPSPATVAAARAQRAGPGAASPASASSPSCADRRRRDPLGGARAARRSSARPPSCCPSWRRCAASSRRATTTSTSHDHTLEVLDAGGRARARPRAASLGAELARARSRALLAEPLADELTRGGALRLGALLHDIAKPRDARRCGDGGFGFLGHDRAGADARARRSSRGCAPASACARTSPRSRATTCAPGFLVRERPLRAARVYALPARCDAGRGRRHAAVGRRPAGDARAQGARRRSRSHLELARELLGRRARAGARDGPPTPLVRGDELARELGHRSRGPQLGELLAEIAAAQYAGEVTTREQAVEHARGCSRAGAQRTRSPPSRTTASQSSAASTTVS